MDKVALCKNCGKTRTYNKEGLCAKCEFEKRNGTLEDLTSLTKKKEEKPMGGRGPCREEGCDSKAIKKSLCYKHYKDVFGEAPYPVKNKPGTDVPVKKRRKKKKVISPPTLFIGEFPKVEVEKFEGIKVIQSIPGNEETPGKIVETFFYDGMWIGEKVNRLVEVK